MIPSVLKINKDIKAVSEISLEEMATLHPVIQRLLIMDIDNVQPQFLPFLAAWFRVEYWDNDWPIDKQREKVKNARAVFRKLGTPWAVQQTLDFLSSIYGYPLSFTEWFNMQPEGERGTFMVHIAGGENGFVLDEEFYKKLYAGVERNKRGSQHWGLRINENVSGECYVGSYLYSSEFGRVISHE